MRHLNGLVKALVDLRWAINLQNIYIDKKVRGRIDCEEVHRIVPLENIICRLHS